jgi:hypothetical protein
MRLFSAVLVVALPATSHGQVKWSADELAARVTEVASRAVVGFAGTVKAVRTVDGKPYGDRETSVYRNGLHALVISRDNKSGDQFLYATNSDYSFKLLDNGSGWKVVGYAAEPPRHGGDPAVSAEVREMADGFSCEFITVEGVRLDTLLRSGKITVANWMTAPEGINFKLVRSADYVRSGKLFIPFRECSCTLDADSLAVRSYKCQSDYSNALSQVSYVSLGSLRLSDRLTVPQTATLTSDQTRDSGKLVMVKTYTYSKPSETAGPEAFYLSHYGLPEPPGVDAPRRPGVWKWVGLVAAGLLAVAIVARAVRRRG